MRYDEITNEMTMKAGSYEGLGRYTHQFSSFNQNGKHVGDIEEYQVYKSNDGLGRYAAFNKDAVIAFWQIDINNVLQAVYVLPEYRKQGLFSAILFFLKRNEGFSKILLGDHQSNITYEAIKRIYKRFTNVYWEKDGNTVPYDPSTIDDFYSLTGPTGWKIVLEHTGQVTESKYFNPLQLETWYFNLLDE